MHDQIRTSVRQWCSPCMIPAGVVEVCKCYPQGCVRVGADYTSNLTVSFLSM